MRDTLLVVRAVVLVGLGAILAIAIPVACSSYSEEEALREDGGGADSSNNNSESSSGGSDAVAPIDGFAMTVAPSKLALDETDQAQVGVTITRAPGFTSPIDVTLNGLPASVSASPLVIVDNGGTITLTIAGAAKGISKLTAIGRAGDKFQTAPLDLIIGRELQTFGDGGAAFVVPGDVDKILVKAWGAGGGGGNQSGNLPGATGGGGGFAAATIAVTANESLTIVVGRGGSGGDTLGGYTVGGHGGGYSAVLRGLTPLLIAGGGGGGGVTGGASGGGGGGLEGQKLTGGREGTQTRGGFGGVGSGTSTSTDGQAGVSLKGGHGACTYTCSMDNGGQPGGGGSFGSGITGGGGGGGFFGGGGGAAVTGTQPNGSNGGGGGSGFAATDAGASEVMLTAAQGASVAQSTDPFYRAPAGTGGAVPGSIGGTPTRGGNGLIVLLRPHIAKP